MTGTMAQCQQVERRAWAVLSPAFEARGVRFETPFLSGLTADGFRALGYDVVATYPDGGRVKVELKAEEANRYGNLFLETWSNKTFEDPPHWSRTGWLFTCKADRLWYFFLESRELYVADFRRLQAWAFGDPGSVGHIYRRFSEKTQDKRPQPNRTCGHAVPIPVLVREVGLGCYRVTEDGRILRVE